jgi:hypothetical protein
MGLIPGVLCFLSIFTLVFEDYEKNNKDDDHDNRFR